MAAELEEKRDLKNRACRCGTNFQRFLRLVSLKTSPLKTENWARGMSLKKAKKMPRGYIFFLETRIFSSCVGIFAFISSGTDCPISLLTFLGIVGITWLISTPFIGRFHISTDHTHSEMVVKARDRNLFFDFENSIFDCAS